MFILAAYASVMGYIIAKSDNPNYLLTLTGLFVRRRGSESIFWPLDGVDFSPGSSYKPLIYVRAMLLLSLSLFLSYIGSKRIPTTTDIKLLSQ